MVQFRVSSFYVQQSVIHWLNIGTWRNVSISWIPTWENSCRTKQISPPWKWSVTEDLDVRASRRTTWKYISMERAASMRRNTPRKSPTMSKWKKTRTRTKRMRTWETHWTVVQMSSIHLWWVRVKEGDWQLPSLEMLAGPALKIDTYVFQQMASINENEELDFIYEIRVQFDSQVNDSVTRMVEIKNVGTTVFYYEWQQKPYTKPFDIVNSKVQRFYFDNRTSKSERRPPRLLNPIHCRACLRSLWESPFLSW